MKVLLPVLYCPSSSTDGLASKSPSDSSGLRACVRACVQLVRERAAWVGGAARRGRASWYSKAEQRQQRRQQQQQKHLPSNTLSLHLKKCPNLYTSSSGRICQFWREQSREEAGGGGVTEGGPRLACGAGRHTQQGGPRLWDESPLNQSLPPPPPSPATHLCKVDFAQALGDAGAVLGRQLHPPLALAPPKHAARARVGGCRPGSQVESGGS